MEIKIIEQNKKDFLDILLLGDEEECMIDKYLECGTLFALYDDDLKSVCVVTDCRKLSGDDGVYEIQNIATYTRFHRKGYASKLINFVFDYYKNACKKIILGTGDVPSVLAFYEYCGFTISHRVDNFFIDNYKNPIIEDGILLVDKVYLEKNF